MYASNGQTKNDKKGDILFIAQTKGTLKKEWKIGIKHISMCYL